MEQRTSWVIPEALWLWPSAKPELESYAWSLGSPQQPPLAALVRRGKVLGLQEAAVASLSTSIRSIELCFLCAQLPSCPTGFKDSTPERASSLPGGHRQTEQVEVERGGRSWQGRHRVSTQRD